MDVDGVRILNEEHLSLLKDELWALVYNDAYADILVICSDGRIKLNSLIINLIFPCLHPVSGYPHLEQALLVPDKTQRQIEQEIVGLLAVLDDQVSATAAQSTEVRADANNSPSNTLLSCTQNKEHVEVDGQDDNKNSSEDDAGNNSCSDSWVVEVKSVAPIIQSDSVQNKNTRLRRSHIWDHFRRSDFDEESAHCHYCGKQIRTRKGCTTTMIRHLRAKHAEIYSRADKASSNTKKEDAESGWLAKFSTPINRENVTGIGCAICNKIFKTTPVGFSGLVRHIEQKHGHIFKTLCFVCKLPLEEGQTFPSCLTCGCKYHPTCVPVDEEPGQGTTRINLTDDDNFQELKAVAFSLAEISSEACAYCNKQQHRRHQRTKYKLNRINSSDKVASLCPNCGKKYKNITTHIRTHHHQPCVKVDKGARHERVQCDICTKVFSRKTHLKEHIKSVHDKIKAHKCKFCCREFYRKSNFRRHVRTMHMHVPDNNEVVTSSFACVQCDKVFKSRNSLNKHQRVVHLKLAKSKPEAVCKDCGQSFTQAGSMYEHVRKVHGREPPIPPQRQKMNIQHKVLLDKDTILRVHPELKLDLD